MRLPKLNNRVARERAYHFELGINRWLKNSLAFPDSASASTWRSIGPTGLALSVALFGGIIWVLADLGLINATEPTVLSYVLLILVSLVMAIGISWSHVRRRVTGQSDIDDLET